MCARADGTPWACGRAAADRLAELVAEGPVRCRPEDTDRYGRLVSTCTAGGVDLGGRLVAEGLARAYTRFSDAYVALEAEARAARLGLWQGAAEAPWEYRAETAPSATQGFVPAAGGPPPGCAIKGNVSGRRRTDLPPARRARLRAAPASTRTAARPGSATRTPPAPPASAPRAARR